MAKIAKLFTNGRSQAVRLPAEFRFPGKEVIIERDGDKVILRAMPDSWQAFFGRPAAVPADFMTDRQDPPPQPRDLF